MDDYFTVTKNRLNRLSAHNKANGGPQKWN